MANEIRIRYPATGLTMYCTIRSRVGMYWNTSGTPAFETLTVGHWANYAIDLTETPSGGYYYVGTFPAISGNMTAGWYTMDFYIGSGAISDSQVASQVGYWDGTSLHLESVDIETVLDVVVPAGGLATHTDAQAIQTTCNTINVNTGSIPTVAQIASGVWRDTTASDFTLTGSIGKSLAPATLGTSPGASGGHFIAGTNAATTVTTSFTTTFTGNLTGSAGVDWARVTNPASAVALTGTTISPLQQTSTVALPYQFSLQLTSGTPTNTNDIGTYTANGSASWLNSTASQGLSYNGTRWQIAGGAENWLAASVGTNGLWGTFVGQSSAANAQFIPIGSPIDTSSLATLANQATAQTSLNTLTTRLPKTLTFDSNNMLQSDTARWNNQAVQNLPTNFTNLAIQAGTGYVTSTNGGGGGGSVSIGGSEITIN